MHLGNYFGAVREHVRLQYEYPGDAFYLIADYHALTTQPHPDLLVASAESLALDYLALGLDPNTSTLYRQSDVPQLCELMWILACATRKTRLDRTDAYTSATGRGQLGSVGLYLYPALMAADVLALRGTDVPVGEDQRQHLEIIRDVARSFNDHWTAVLAVPQLRATAAPLVLGTNGEKMSKSRHNVLPVFWNNEDELAARVMSIVTRTVSPGAPIAAERSAVFALYQLVARPDEIGSMSSALESGGLSHREAKTSLLHALRRYFAPYRERRHELAAHPDAVEDILRDGARRAREEAETTLDAVREAVGLGRYRRRTP